MRAYILASALTGIAMAFAGSACLMKSSDCTFDSTCAGVAPPNGSDGGPSTDAEGGAVTEPPVPPGCDVTADAKDSLPCAATSFALFVDANAPDGGDGSKEKPFRAIQSAIDAVATSGKHRIYVCGAATYAEHLKMTAATYARLLGGFDCASWAPAAQKPKVAPADAGYALHIDAVTSEVRVEDIAFEAIAGTPAAKSSIAVFVASSPNVLFKRADIKANAGAPGRDGESGTTGKSEPANVDGTPASATDATGGQAKTCLCDSGGSTTGGKGGDVGGTNTNGANGMPTMQSPTLPNAGAGQSQLSCNTGVAPAAKGSDAPAAADAPPPLVGILDATGWLPGDGSRGVSGLPGQGGGGGGSANQSGTNNGGGGGGGCGGCGGTGGTGGTAGGSSIALALFNAPVRLVAGELVALDGAAGGNGKPGGAGANGGAKGPGYKDGCAGGAGGLGGRGGAGAGGAGGVAAAILYYGGPPTNDGAILTSGVRGSGGLGGTAINQGADGLAGALVELK